MPHGQYVPFEGYDTVHRCNNPPASSSRSTTPTHQHRQADKRAEDASVYDDLGFVDFNLPDSAIRGETDTKGARQAWAGGRQRTPQVPPRAKADSTQAQMNATAGTRARTPPQHSAPVVRKRSGENRSALMIVSVILLAVAGIIILVSVLRSKTQTSAPATTSRGVETTSNAGNRGAPFASVQNSNLAAEQPADAARRFYEQGVAYTRNNKYGEAADAYQQAILLDPNMAEAHHELGYAYIKLGKYSDAATALKKAASLKPDNAETLRLLGTAYARQKHWSDAAASFSQAVKLQPDSAAVYQGLGEAYKQLNRTQDAITAYSELVRLKPKNALAHYELGMLYVSVNDADSALGQYEILLKLDEKLAQQLYEALPQMPRSK
jgi:Flp pilus assembly protein TadD